MASFVRFLAAAFCILVLTTCADLETQSSPLVAASSSATYVLDKTVRASPAGGKARRLNQGSLWAEFGTVAEGTVYRPRGAVLTAEATNVHEAYIVVRDGSWVGFWLPVEKAFAPISTPVPISMTRGGQ
jgi:hypothetical protein